MKIGVDGCEISYEITGDGPPVVLIHGLGGSTVIWAGVRDSLAERGHCVVALDLRGSGASLEPEPREALTLSRWAADLRAVLEELGLRRPALVGHSLGASIAVKYALRWEDDVAALVLMGADPELAVHLAPRVERWVELIGDVGLERWVAEFWSTNPPFSAASVEADPTIVDRYAAMLLGNDPDSYIRTCLAIASSESLTPVLSSVRQPALVIAGSDDDRTRPEAGRKLAAAIPNAGFVELEGVGHTMPFEAPGAVAAAIASFVDGRGEEPLVAGRSDGDAP